MYVLFLYKNVYNSYSYGKFELWMHIVMEDVNFFPCCHAYLWAQNSYVHVIRSHAAVHCTMMITKILHLILEAKVFQWHNSKDSALISFNYKIEIECYVTSFLGHRMILIFLMHTAHLYSHRVLSLVGYSDLHSMKQHHLVLCWSLE